MLANCFLYAPEIEIILAVAAVMVIFFMGFAAGAITMDYRLGRLIRTEIKLREQAKGICDEQ